VDGGIYPKPYDANSSLSQAGNPFHQLLVGGFVALGGNSVRVDEIVSGLLRGHLHTFLVHASVHLTLVPLWHLSQPCKDTATGAILPSELVCKPVVSYDATRIESFTPFLTDLSMTDTCKRSFHQLSASFRPVLLGRERERDLLQVPHFFVGTLQPL